MARNARNLRPSKKSEIVMGRREESYLEFVRFFSVIIAAADKIKKMWLLNDTLTLVTLFEFSILSEFFIHLWRIEMNYVHTLKTKYLLKFNKYFFE